MNNDLIAQLEAKIEQYEQALETGQGSLWPSEVNEFCKIVLNDIKIRGSDE